MLHPPDGLDDAAVRAALVERWGIAPREIAYAPVGFGSHHWLTEDHFVSVDVASESPTLGAALRTATALRDDAGLAFVIAPIPTPAGSLLEPVPGDWVLHVYPRLSIIDATDFGPHTDPEVVELVEALHAATPAAAPHVGTEDFSIWEREDLEEALDDLDQPWGTGPFGEPARALLATHADDVRRLLAAHDQMVAAVPREGWVVTHGEPHRGNVFRTTEGWAIVDWDTVLLAPPERDLWDLPARGDAARTTLYRLRWDLSEIAVYTSVFHDEHAGDPNDVQSWAGLRLAVDARTRWPDLL